MKKLYPAKLVKLISEAYQKKQGVFKHRVNAEDHIPKNCTDLEKALFLFYTVQLDYSIKSQNLYLGSNELWSINKRYFYPKVISNIKTSKLEELLKIHLKPRYINEAVKRWKYNSEKLIKEYNGNPLKIFSSTNDSITIMKRIYDFRGFGPKIGNFFFRAMLNTFNLKLANINEVHQPVDLHDIRLTYAWGFIKTPEVNSKNIKETQRIWKDACNETNVSWLVFDRALWILGSEGVRSDNRLEDLRSNLGLKSLNL